MVVSLSPKYEGEGSILSTKIEILAKSFTNGPSPFTADARDLYVATSPQLLTRDTVTLGRRAYQWSAVDEHWRLGLWAPRFLWDPIQPELLGRVGAFYQHAESFWSVTVNVSPIAGPEQSYPVKQVGTTLGAASPFWSPLPESVLLNGQLVPVSYTIQYPSARDFFLIPNGSMNFRVGGNDGGWGQVSYAYTPIGQARIAIEPKINLVGSASFDTMIHPTFPYHHLTAFEAGYKDKRWSLWGSITRDIPQKQELPGTWLARPLDPNTIGSIGGSVEPWKGFSLSSSYLAAHQSEVTDAMNASMLTRQPVYMFTQAVDFGLSWRNGSRVAYDLNAIYDIDNVSTRVSLDLTLIPKLGRSNWIAGIGFDAIVSSTGEGWIGQFVGDDRVRWRLGYAF